jgi:hypothetical protein
MSPLIILGLIAAVPVVFILLLRSNAAIVFLSLCAGSVLATYASNDALSVVSGKVAQNNLPSLVQIGLLVVPAILSLLMLRKSVSPAKLPLNAITAVAAGVLVVILVVPLLPGGVQANILQSSIWSQTAKYHSWAIAGGTFITLVSLWLTKPHKEGHRKKSH